MPAKPHFSRVSASRSPSVKACVRLAACLASAACVVLAGCASGKANAPSAAPASVGAAAASDAPASPLATTPAAATGPSSSLPTGKAGGAPGVVGASAFNPVNWITPYRIDVVQGNFISKEQVENLRAGMTRAQVKELLGTPLLTSLFHADRWDYVFTLKRRGVESQAYKYTVFFKGDALALFEGDAMPSEAEFIASIDNKRKLSKPPVLEATEEQLKAFEKNAVPKTSPSTDASALPPAPASYPPLER